MRVAMFVALACLASAQEKPLTFEVASLRRAEPLTDTRLGGIRGGPRTANPGRITARAMTLRALLREAYGLQLYQISGPKWGDDERYDVVANVPAGATREEAMAMLQNLLAERLKVRIRMESREVPVYALRAGKNGHKLTQSDGEVDFDGVADYFQTNHEKGKDGFPVTAGVLRSGIVFSYGDGGKISVVRQTLTRFAAVLSNRLDRPVLDETGLKGLYSFDVYFAPPRGPANYSPSDDVGDGVSLFSAIPQQLGLQLASTKGLVPFLIVESAERIPTEN
jgi:uncharacterized protein (TIGR03435 family)